MEDDDAGDELLKTWQIDAAVDRQKLWQLATD